MSASMVHDILIACGFIAMLLTPCLFSLGKSEAPKDPVK